MATRVYVGHLPQKATESDVQEFFRDYGTVRKVVMKKGYCFVEFDNLGDAESAVRALDGTDFMGEKVRIEIARGIPRGRDREGWKPPLRQVSSGAAGSRSRSRSPRHRRREDEDTKSRMARVIVENLSPQVSLRDLKQLFNQVGQVTKVEVYERLTSEGAIEFASSADTRAAIRRYDGQLFQGRKIRVHQDVCLEDGNDKVTRTKAKLPATGPAHAEDESRAAKPDSSSPKTTSDDDDDDDKSDSGSSASQMLE